MSANSGLRRTPLYGSHLRAGARMVDFGGWEMPVQYSGILAEHRAVRSAAGLFDVSHMGEIEVLGPEALRLVNFVTTNDAGRLAPGQAQYSALLYEHGGFVDDILVHKVNERHFFLCVNAANQQKDYRHIQACNQFDAEVVFASERYAQLAIQGPKAQAVLARHTKTDLASLRYYRFVDSEVCGVSARIARTGYTGEDGFELYLPPEAAERVWDALLESGETQGVLPCGLGARNTLRLEAAMPLYGHEIDATVYPFEAGLDWIFKPDKGDFVGKQAVLKAAEKGPRRRLAGLEMKGRAVARDGYEVHVEGEAVGWVTSGGPAPHLNKNVALCYLPPAWAEAGKTVSVLVRNQPAEATVVPIPFYKRAKI